MFFTPFFTAVYIVEQLVLQIIYVLKKKNLQFLSLKSAVIIESGFKSRAGYKSACTVVCLTPVGSSIQF